MPPPTKPPRKGQPLHVEEIPRYVEEAIAASGLTLEGVAERVVEATERKSLSRAAIYNAKANRGSTLALQLDILRTLWGAEIEGPFYRVA